MLCCILLFIPGGIFQTELCRYWTNQVPDGAKRFDEALANGIQHMRWVLVHQRSKYNYAEFGDGGFDANLDIALKIVKLNLTDTLLNRCENESFITAIRESNVVWPVMNEVRIYILDLNIFECFWFSIFNTCKFTIKMKCWNYSFYYFV